MTTYVCLDAGSAALEAARAFSATGVRHQDWFDCVVIDNHPLVIEYHPHWTGNGKIAALAPLDDALHTQFGLGTMAYTHVQHSEDVMDETCVLLIGTDFGVISVTSRDRTTRIAGAPYHIAFCDLWKQASCFEELLELVLFRTEELNRSALAFLARGGYGLRNQPKDKS